MERSSTIVSLLTFAYDWILIIAVSYTSWRLFSRYGLSFWTIVFYLLALAVIGSRQKGLENLMHEGTHGNLSANKKLNDFMALFLGGVWLSPGWTPENEREGGHLGGHHGNFGDREKDREIWDYKDNRGLGALPASSIRKSIEIFCVALIKSFWWRIYRIWKAIVANPLTLVLGGGAIAALSYVGLILPFVLFWLLPFVLIYFPMRFFAEVSEHMGLHHDSEFGGTRNKLGWLQEHVIHPHGDGFHLVHHLYPRVPHYKLSKAHKLLLQDAEYRTKGQHHRNILSTSSDLFVQRKDH